MDIQWVHLQLLEALKLLDSAGRGKHLCTHTVQDPKRLAAGRRKQFLLLHFQDCGFSLTLQTKD